MPKFNLSYHRVINTSYFYDLSLFENLKAVGEILIPNARDRIEKINYLTSKFDLESFRDIKAKFLSGGQKK